MHIRKGNERLAGYEHINQLIHQGQLILQLPRKEHLQRHRQHQRPELLEVDASEQSLGEEVQSHQLVS